MRAILFVGLFSMILLTESTEIDLNYLKCLVCRVTMEEVHTELLKIQASKVVNVGSHRLDAQGNTINKQISLKFPEGYVFDILDNICEKMNDYVRARRKSDNSLILISLMSSDAMNPKINEVNIIQDSDLNKSLPYYCYSIVEEYESDIISLYQFNKDDKTNRLCTHISRICWKYVEHDDYEKGEDNDDDYDEDEDKNENKKNENKNEDKDEYESKNEDEVDDLDIYLETDSITEELKHTHGEL